MKHFLIQATDYQEYDIWCTYPWWKIFKHNNKMIVIDGSVENCLKYVHDYCKDNYIYKYKITVNRY